MNTFKGIFTFLVAIGMTFMLGCTHHERHHEKHEGSKHETAGEYIDDSVITTKVKSAIFNEPGLKSAEINVETYKGVVQLSGFVRSQANINRAVEVARGVRGLKSVKNDMRVK